MMETFSALLAFLQEIHQKRSFGVFFDLRLNQQLQTLETPVIRGAIALIMTSL